MRQSVVTNNAIKISSHCPLEMWIMIQQSQNHRFWGLMLNTKYHILVVSLRKNAYFVIPLPNHLRNTNKKCRGLLWLTRQSKASKMLLRLSMITWCLLQSWEVSTMEVKYHQFCQSNYKQTCTAAAAQMDARGMMFSKLDVQKATFLELRKHCNICGTRRSRIFIVMTYALITLLDEEEKQKYSTCTWVPDWIYAWKTL